MTCTYTEKREIERGKEWFRITLKIILPDPVMTLKNRDNIYLCTVVVNYTYAFHFAFLSDILFAIYIFNGYLYSRC